MVEQNNYRNLLDAIMKGEKENQKLQNYIVKIVPEKASDKKYIEKLTNNVFNIYNETDLDIEIYWIADKYIDMLREAEAF